MKTVFILISLFLSTTFAQCDSLKYVVNFQKQELKELREQIIDLEMQLVKINLVEEQVSKVAESMGQYKGIIDSLRLKNDTLLENTQTLLLYIQYLESYLSPKKIEYAKKDLQDFMRKEEEENLEEGSLRP